jgi:hypothetical protein
MDGRDDESGSGDRGEVPWELDFTLARVRRPRLLRPSRAERARAQEPAAASAPPSGGGGAGPGAPTGEPPCEDTVRLTDGVPGTLGRPTLTPPSPSPSRGGVAPATRPAPSPTRGRSAPRSRWSRARTELAVKVTCGIALVGGTAALVTLALLG